MMFLHPGLAMLWVNSTGSLFQMGLAHCCGDGGAKTQIDQQVLVRIVRHAHMHTHTYYIYIHINATGRLLNPNMIQLKLAHLVQLDRPTEFEYVTKQLLAGFKPMDWLQLAQDDLHVFSSDLLKSEI